MKNLAVWLLVLALLTGCAQGAADDKAAGSGSQEAVSQGERAEAEDQANSSGADSSEEDAEADRSAAGDQADSSAGDSSTQERALSEEASDEWLEGPTEELPDFGESSEKITDFIFYITSELENCTPLSEWKMTNLEGNSMRYTSSQGVSLQISENDEGMLCMISVDYSEEQGEWDETKFRDFCCICMIIASYFEADIDIVMQELELERMDQKDLRGYKGVASYLAIVDKGSITVAVMPRK